MLARTHRFHGQRNLKRVYQQGATARGQLLSLRYLDRDNHRPYRVAVVVSRQVNKSAVVRNRIRRRIYEQVRLASNLPADRDLVFTVYNDRVSELDASELKAMISELLQKTYRDLPKT